MTTATLERPTPPVPPDNTAHLTCPACGAAMLLRNSSYGHFYSCSRWPACENCHGCHQKGRKRGQPLGTPADGATRRARIRAHAALDRLWKSGEFTGEFTRAEAYQLLKDLLFIPGHRAHIGMLHRWECDVLVRKLVELELADPALMPVEPEEED